MQVTFSVTDALDRIPGLRKYRFVAAEKAFYPLTGRAAPKSADKLAESKNEHFGLFQYFINTSTEFCQELERALQPGNVGDNLHPTTKKILSKLNDSVQIIRISGEEGTPTIFIDNDTGEIAEEFHEDFLRYAEHLNLEPKILTAGRRTFDPYTLTEDRLIYKTDDADGYPSYVNLYRAPDWRQTTKIVSETPATVKWFVQHLVGGCPISEDYLYGWLRHLLLVGRNETALTMIAPKGLGKNLFYEQILKPLVGERYCGLGTRETFTGGFNSELGNKILVLFDEFELDDTGISKFKASMNPVLSLVAKGRDAVDVPNFANFIIFANEADKVRISSDDRRFSVPNVGHKPLPQVCDNIPKLIQTLAEEVYDFGHWLLSTEFPNFSVSLPLITGRFEYLVKVNRPEYQELVEAMFSTLGTEENESLELQYKEIRSAAKKKSIKLPPRYDSLLSFCKTLDGATVTDTEIGFIVKKEKL